MEISLNNSVGGALSTAEKELLEAERTNILSEIKKVKCELQSAYNNFDFVDDSLMVDYYTYQIKAYETKFEYLLKKAKAMGICEI